VDDFYVSIGTGDLPIARIVKYLTLGEKEDQVEEYVTPSKTEHAVSEDTVTVLGLKGLLTTLARCCNPVPGMTLSVM